MLSHFSSRRIVTPFRPVSGRSFHTGKALPHAHPVDQRRRQARSLITAAQGNENGSKGGDQSKQEKVVQGALPKACPKIASFFVYSFDNNLLPEQEFGLSILCMSSPNRRVHSELSKCAAMYFEIHGALTICSLCNHIFFIILSTLSAADLKRGGVDQETAQKVLKAWEETGNSTPDQLRKLLLGRSLKTAGLVGLQTLLDAGKDSQEENPLQRRPRSWQIFLC